VRVLLAAPIGYGTKGQWYLRALTNAGCDVAVVDRKYFFPGTKFILSKAIHKLVKTNRRKLYNDAIIDTTLQLKPNLVVIAKGTLVLPETLLTLKDIHNRTIIFNLNNDDYFSAYKSNTSASLHTSIALYDCLFATRPVNVSELVSHGANRAEYLPFCYDPSVNFPIKSTPWEREKYGSDISFIGSFEKERAILLQSLSDYNLTIWGNNWTGKMESKVLDKRIKNKDIYELELSKAVNSSKIVLNFFRKGNRDVLNSRVFELPACKGFVISERSNELLEYFEENKEIVCFDSSEELKEKVDYYLKSETLRNQIAMAGYKKLKKLNCTVYDRARAVLKVYSEF